jgi:hypothetical protein
MSAKTVFISYSHDSDTHRERVLALSERLRDDGIETLLGVTPYPWTRPQEDLAAAEKLIYECGYHRRDEELSAAKRVILGAEKPE